MPETYAGGCHCGAVRYEVGLNLAEPVMQCNCSICSKRGYLLAFAPRDAFRLLAGADATTGYLFNKKVVNHLFCSTCGVASYGTGTAPNGDDVVAINVRCLDSADLGSLTIMPIDGKSL